MGGYLHSAQMPSVYFIYRKLSTMGLSMPEVASNPAFRSKENELNKSHQSLQPAASGFIELFS